MWNGVVYGADAVVGGDMEVLTEGWVQGVEVDCEVSVCRVFKLSLSEMKVIEAHYEVVEAGDGNTESGEGDSDVGKTHPLGGSRKIFGGICGQSPGPTHIQREGLRRMHFENRNIA